AVFLVVNVEEWAFDEPIPRPVLPPPAGGAPPVPDVPNWAWHEYGMRVGFWRIKELLDRYGIRATLALNASVARTYPPIVDAARGRLLAVPYTLEVNDSPLFAVQHAPGEEFVRRARAHFDTLYAEGATSARVMPIALHPYLIGVPHRIGLLDAALGHIRRHDGVVFWTGEQILDWHRSRPAR